MITITNLTKHRGPLAVLSDINLTVNIGEVTALVGPSGGGKSTLLRCINGLETFEAGQVQVGTFTLAANTPTTSKTLIPLRRTVGMVFQQFHLFPHLTALENVMCGPRYALQKSKAESQDIAQKLLARVGLSDKHQSKPDALSGGQQQRVAIARALAVEPAVMLFDEPTSALDPLMAREVLAVMRDLASSGQTMIVVTHDMDFAKQATIAHHMEAGRITRSGPPRELLSEPAA